MRLTQVTEAQNAPDEEAIDASPFLVQGLTPERGGEIISGIVGLSSDAFLLGFENELRQIQGGGHVKFTVKKAGTGLSAAININHYGLKDGLTRTGTDTAIDAGYSILMKGSVALIFSGASFVGSFELDKQYEQLIDSVDSYIDSYVEPNSWSNSFIKQLTPRTPLYALKLCSAANTVDTAIRDGLHRFISPKEDALSPSEGDLLQLGALFLEIAKSEHTAQVMACMKEEFDTFLNYAREEFATCVEQYKTRNKDLTRAPSDTDSRPDFIQAPKKPTVEVKRRDVAAINAMNKTQLTEKDSQATHLNLNFQVNPFARETFRIELGVNMQSGSQTSGDIITFTIKLAVNLFKLFNWGGNKKKKENKKKSIKSLNRKTKIFSENQANQSKRFQTLELLLQGGNFLEAAQMIEEIRRGQMALNDSANIVLDKIGKCKKNNIKSKRIKEMKEDITRYLSLHSDYDEKFTKARKFFELLDLATAHCAEGRNKFLSNSNGSSMFTEDQLNEQLLEQEQFLEKLNLYYKDIKTSMKPIDEIIDSASVHSLLASEIQNNQERISLLKTNCKNIENLRARNTEILYRFEDLSLQLASERNENQNDLFTQILNKFDQHERVIEEEINEAAKQLENRHKKTDEILKGLQACKAEFDDAWVTPETSASLDEHIRTIEMDMEIYQKQLCLLRADEKMINENLNLFTEKDTLLILKIMQSKNNQESCRLLLKNYFSNFVSSDLPLSQEKLLVFLDFLSFASEIESLDIEISTHEKLESELKKCEEPNIREMLLYGLLLLYTSCNGNPESSDKIILYGNEWLKAHPEDIRIKEILAISYFERGEFDAAYQLTNSLIASTSEKDNIIKIHRFITGYNDVRVGLFAANLLLLMINPKSRATKNLQNFLNIGTNPSFLHYLGNALLSDHESESPRLRGMRAGMHLLESTKREGVLLLDNLELASVVAKATLDNLPDGRFVIVRNTLRSFIFASEVATSVSSMHHSVRKLYESPNIMGPCLILEGASNLSIMAENTYDYIRELWARYKKSPLPLRSENRGLAATQSLARPRMFVLAGSALTLFSQYGDDLKLFSQRLPGFPEILTSNLSQMRQTVSRYASNDKLKWIGYGFLLASACYFLFSFRNNYYKNMFTRLSFNCRANAINGDLSESDRCFRAASNYQWSQEALGALSAQQYRDEALSLLQKIQARLPESETREISANTASLGNNMETLLELAIDKLTKALSKHTFISNEDQPSFVTDTLFMRSCAYLLHHSNFPLKNEENYLQKAISDLRLIVSAQPELCLEAYLKLGLAYKISNNFLQASKTIDRLIKEIISRMRNRKIQDGEKNQFNEMLIHGVYLKLDILKDEINELIKSNEILEIPEKISLAKFDCLLAIKDLLLCGEEQKPIYEHFSEKINDVTNELRAHFSSENGDRKTDFIERELHKIRAQYLRAVAKNKFSLFKAPKSGPWLESKERSLHQFLHFLFPKESTKLQELKDRISKFISSLTKIKVDSMDPQALPIGSYGSK